jgi:alpha-1,2-mannosyltransferase
MMGTVRDKDDQRIVDELKQLVEELELQDSVEIRVNTDFATLRKILSQAKVAIHTMRNEHFGIVVAELMVSGIITVAHNSAGPKEDIIGTEDLVGFLATNEQEYISFVKNSFL